MAQNAAPLAAAFLATSAVALLLFAALHDLAARTVPNAASGAIAALGLGLRTLAGDLAAALAAALLVFVLAAFCWRRGWLGGGDVKLLGAAALLVAPPRLPALLAAVALAGGGLALVYLALSVLLPAAARPPASAPRRSGATIWRRVLRVERRRIRRRGPLPYASAIAAGAMIVLLRG